MVTALPDAVRAAVTVVEEPVAGLTLAMALLDEVQLTLIDELELSAKLPVAVSCVLPPAVIIGFVGEIVIDCRAAVVTVSVVLAVIAALEFAVAVMVVVPAAIAVASPPEVMVATLGVPVVQLTLTVDARLPSLFTPVAVNCWLEPTAIFGLAGMMLIDVSVGSTKNPHERSVKAIASTPTLSGKMRSHRFRLRARFGSDGHSTTALRRRLPQPDRNRRNEKQSRRPFIRQEFYQSGPEDPTIKLSASHYRRAIAQDCAAWAELTLTDC